MPILTIGPRESLTTEQQELYDGVLADCAQNRETAITVLDRYARLVEEQACDVAAVRAALHCHTADTPALSLLAGATQ